MRATLIAPLGRSTVWVALAVVLAAVLVSGVSATTISVTADQLNGWVFATQQADASVVPVAEFAQGPGTPPLGAGSFHMLIGEGYDTTGAMKQTKVVLGTNQFAGRKITDITSLKYSTWVQYMSYDSCIPPTLQIGTTFDGGVNQRWYEWQGLANGATQTLQWQTWDLLSDGVWKVYTGTSNTSGNWAWLTTHKGTNKTILPAANGVGDVFTDWILNLTNTAFTVQNGVMKTLQPGMQAGVPPADFGNAWWRNNASMNVFLDQLEIGFANGDLFVFDFEGAPVPVYSINNRSVGDPVVNTAKTKVLFVVWGKLTTVDLDNFLVDDGSGKPIQVHAPGFAYFWPDGTYVKCKGSLNPTATPYPILEAKLSDCEKVD